MGVGLAQISRTLAAEHNVWGRPIFHCSITLEQGQADTSNLFLMTGERQEPILE